MEWNKQIAFTNSNDIYIVFFSLNTEQNVPAHKNAFATFCHLKIDDFDPETLPTSHCGVLSTTLLIRRLISHKKWSPATFSLVTGVVLFVLNILLLLLLPSHSRKMLSIKMSANFHHVFTKDSQAFEMRQWNADYKVIRTPNMYCLLMMLSLTVRVCSFVACKTVVFLHFKYQSCLWYFSEMSI